MSDDPAPKFYIAVCIVCTPRLPMPFFDVEERGRWIKAHHQATAHAVWTGTTEERPR